MSEASANSIRDILSDVRRRLGTAVALVSHFEQGRRVIDIIDSAEPVAFAAGDWDLVEETYCQRIVDGRLPESIPDTAANPTAMAIAATQELAIAAHVGVPIVMDDGAVYGTLCSYSHHRRPDLDERAADLLGLVADTIARSISHDQAAFRSQERVLARLDDVIKGDLLEMHYQPLVDLRTRKVTAVEALARFPSSFGGATGDWFCDALSLGRSAELEALCVRMVAVQLALLPAGVDVHLNLSPALLCQPSMTALLRELPLDRLVLELTEHQVVEDYDALNDTLAPLRAAGMKVAIDDAGAGFASFRHALLLKPDLLKLDISLVRGIDSDLRKRSLGHALTGFAHSTDALIVAEGVETEQEASALLDLGMDLAQGFLFASPAPLTGQPGHADALATSESWAAAPNRVLGLAGAAKVAAGLIEAGASSLTIAGALNRQGLLTPAGRRWHPSSVARYLLAADASAPQGRVS